MATKTNKKAKPATKRKQARKTTAPKTSLVKTIYNQAQGLNFGSDYHQNGTTETCNLYPRNAHAERIIIRQNSVVEAQTEVSMSRLCGGTEYETLNVEVAKGSKAEAHALALIKHQLARFC